MKNKILASMEYSYLSSHKPFQKNVLQKIQTFFVKNKIDSKFEYSIDLDLNLNFEDFPKNKKGVKDICYIYEFSNQTKYLFYNNYMVDLELEYCEKFTHLIIKIYYNNQKYSNIRHIIKQTYDMFKDFVLKYPIVLIKYYHASNGRILYRDFYEFLDDVVLRESYPYIENLEKYIDDYLCSDEKVLLLMGPPGTGKTKFIRHILKRMFYKNKCRGTVYFTNDAKVLNDGNLFIDFSNYSSSGESFIDDKNYEQRLSVLQPTLVLEDIDLNLNARLDGNVFMYKLLSSSDGIIKNDKKKIILSTNLKTISSIDSALIRDGRCYDILKFRNLTYDESVNFVKKFSVEIKLKEKSYALSELYKIIKNKKLNKTFADIHQIGFCTN